MSFKIVITETLNHPDGVTAPTETKLFEQTVAELDLQKFIVALNKPTRRRKGKEKAAQ